MIVLDTHVWIWWMENSPRLGRSIRARIELENDARVSAMSLLEIAQAVSVNRLRLNSTLAQWLEVAQNTRPIRIEPLNATICVASMNLPGTFHRDPADRVIVAVARELNVDLITADGKILAYPHIRMSAPYPQRSVAG